MTPIMVEVWGGEGSETRPLLNVIFWAISWLLKAQGCYAYGRDPSSLQELKIPTPESRTANSLQFLYPASTKPSEGKRCHAGMTAPGDLMWQLSLSIWRSACSNSSHVGSVLRLQQVCCQAVSCCRQDAFSNGANRLGARAIYSACRKASGSQSAVLHVAVTAQTPPWLVEASGL